MRKISRGRLVEVAVEAAARGGELLMHHLGGSFRVRRKGRINLVTEVDMRSEKLITDVILSHFPDHRILAEENKYPEKDSPYKWIIDPLDGTTNYAHGYPFFCVSVAVEHEGQVIIGVVYNPVLEEMFIAERGKGAYLNRKRIRVSRTEKLADSLLATGFSYDVQTTRANLDHWTNFIMRATAVRRDGAAALDLCYVAAGRFDGFWEMKLHPWDTAAGALMVEEAGGRVSDFKGNKLSIYDEEVVASNGKIHDEMIEVLSLGEAVSMASL